MLEIQHLSYQVPDSAGRREILRDVSLTIPDKKFVVITGPNGGGKTTLAKTIMGINRPTAGKIFWAGQEITDLPISDRARLGISYGFQQPPRFKGLRVRDLLDVAAGAPLSTSAACDYLNRVGLCARDYLERDVDASLSGGEVKRIEIATILARKSGLMIFDEPEAGIDLWSFSRLTETFREIHDKKEATILIISHQERIIRLADEILLVAGGRIAAQGSVEEVYPVLMGQTQSGCERLEVNGCAQ